MKTKRFYAATLAGIGKEPTELGSPMCVDALWYFDSESKRKSWLKHSLPDTYNEVRKVKVTSELAKRLLKHHQPFEVDFRDSGNGNSRWGWEYNNIPEHLIYQ